MAGWTGSDVAVSGKDATLPRIDPLVGLITVACAIYGFVAGVFLDGPHRAHWKGGISEPHRGLPQTRATPARFSPPVQKVVDERLADLHLPHVTLPSAPRLALPTVKRGSDAASAVPAPGVGDGLAPAEPVVPQAPASQSKPAVVVPPQRYGVPSSVNARLSTPWMRPLVVVSAAARASATNCVAERSRLAGAVGRTGLARVAGMAEPVTEASGVPVAAVAGLAKAGRAAPHRQAARTAPASGRRMAAMRPEVVGSAVVTRCGRK